MAKNEFYDSVSALQYASQFTDSWKDTHGRTHSLKELEMIFAMQDQIVEQAGGLQGFYLADDMGNIFAAFEGTTQPKALLLAEKSLHSKAKYCPNCGTILQKNWKFCTECGYELES